MKINDRHLCAFANSSAPIDHEGYLLKRGEVNKAYQRRWFILKGNLLFYFEKKGDKEPIGVIILEGCTVELSESVDAFAFQICFEGSSSRSYVLAAETQEKMEKWMKAITCAGYDYMKLMINELQRQVDELNLVEQQKMMTIPKQTQQDLMKEHDVRKKILRNSEVKPSDSDLLIDFNIPSGSDGGKRQGRINPFNDDSSCAQANNDPFYLSPGFSAISAKSTSKVRDFGSMHADFGLYIQQKVMENLS